MSWLISLLIIVSPILNTPDSSNTDVIILEKSSVKGFFIRYASDQIVFFNIQSQDTDYINVNLVKFFFYNSLPSEKYDTLYFSIKQHITGKILFQNKENIVFWDSQDKKIKKYDIELFLNTKQNAFKIKIKHLMTFYISLSVFFFIFGLSLALSKDYFSTALYTVALIASIYFSILIKKISEK